MQLIDIAMATEPAGIRVRGTSRRGKASSAQIGEAGQKAEHVHVIDDRRVPLDHRGACQSGAGRDVGEIGSKFAIVADRKLPQASR
jgi:hypothetical protein